MILFTFKAVEEKKKAPTPAVELKARCSSIKIVKAEKKTVDENHPLVLKLKSAGYSVDQSIDAVARSGSLEEALMYLGSGPVEEDDEDELFQISFGRQLSTGESPADSFKMYV